MNDRLAHLIDKGANSSLTVEERCELARLLNTPIFAEPARFVSKFRFQSTDVLGRIHAIDWFSHYGSPLQIDLTMGFKQVEDWAETIAACGQSMWETVELEAQNQLTFWLHQHARDEYQDWNRRVVEYRAQIIEPITRDALTPVIRSRGLPEGLLQCIQWDLLGALMENSYLPCGHPCGFFLELLTVYEAGHFPCGWQGGWPRGKLLVL